MRYCGLIKLFGKWVWGQWGLELVPGLWMVPLYNGLGSGCGAVLVPGLLMVPKGIHFLLFNVL